MAVNWGARQLADGNMGEELWEGRKDWGAKKKLDLGVPQAYWDTVVHAFNSMEAEAGESVELSGSSQFQGSRGYTVGAPSPKQITQKAWGTGFTEEGELLVPWLIQGLQA